jgi:hypothetical protein
MAGPFGPFEWTFEWLGDTLINKVGEEIFGDGAAARQTIMVVYNHGNQDHFYLSNLFESGGFTAGAQPGQIAAGTIGGYKVEPHGIATGVTGADVRFGFSPFDSDYCLRIVTSNPYAGGNSAQADLQRGITETRCSRPVIATKSTSTSIQADEAAYEQIPATRTYRELASISQTILLRSLRASV